MTKDTWNIPAMLAVLVLATSLSLTAQPVLARESGLHFQARKAKQTPALRARAIRDSRRQRAANKRLAEQLKRKQPARKGAGTAGRR